jgi:ankyrin repeat protein
MNDRPQYWVPNSGESGMTDLHYAAYLQDLDAVKQCVEDGFDVNQKDNAGWTTLIWCIDMAATGQIGTAEAIVDYLIAHGAEINYTGQDYSNLVEFARSRDMAVAEHLEKILAR